MFDVAIIGSGYGGAVAAARLAGHGRVLLIERGRRWSSGDFPQGIGGLVESYRTRRNPLGLWSMRLGDGTGNAFASAFGGSSAINYGITSKPDAHAFDGWPVTGAELEPFFERARSTLRPELNPIADDLGDKQFLDLVEPGRRVDLENTIDWQRCTQCGHCVPGCNESAKRSLDTSYLAEAMTRGIELRLESDVRSILRRRDGYEVVVARTGTDDTENISTRRLIVAAGTLGTLDILHGSRESLPLGPQFGRGMSMNGDAVAFLYNTRHPLSGHSGAPISTSVRIPFRNAAGETKTLMVMSGRVPRAALRFSGTALALFNRALGRRRFLSNGEPMLDRLLRQVRDLGEPTMAGALSRSFMYKLDAQDESRGVARFEGGRSRIDWPDYADDPILRFAAERLETWARKVGGRVIPNLALLPGMRSFSVHPLGGCRMGTSIEDGVVDDMGRVFAPDGGVYSGLRVIDGSIIPSSLGVPPSLTIAALAERIAADVLTEL